MSRSWTKAKYIFVPIYCYLLVGGDPQIKSPMLHAYYHISSFTQASFLFPSGAWLSPPHPRSYKALG